jgi:alpha-galactosidase
MLRVFERVFLGWACCASALGVAVCGSEGQQAPVQNGQAGTASGGQVGGGGSSGLDVAGETGGSSVDSGAQAPASDAAFESAAWPVDAAASGCHATLPRTSTTLVTPPMGWSSGGKIGCAVDADTIKKAADALVSTGLRDSGYDHVIVDDCWQSARAGDGSIGVDAKFPGGLKALADYVHSKGLRFGVGTSRGATTCGGRPGSQDHEAQDAASYAAAGVDYVKVDNCNGNPADDVRKSQFSAMGTALAAKSILLSIYPYPAGVDIETFQQWMSTVGQVFRNAGSISDTWSSIVSNVDSNADGVAYTRGGSFNDPGLLQIGNGGMSDVEYRSQMSLWAIMAAPLIVGNDIANASQATLDTLSNPEVIAVDRDPLVLSGFRVGTGGAYGGGVEVWSKPLVDCGARAVALFNRNAAAMDVSVSWAQIGIAPGSASVRDLWTHTDMASASDMLTVHVPAHGTALLKIKGAELAPPSGDKMLSDLPWIYAANSVGPAERDLSNKERAAGDGTPLSIDGKRYDKGLGVHAASLVTYRLGGACTSFTSDVGVDDEVGMAGSVVFQVWTDGTKVFDSGIMRGKMPAKSVSVDVTGKTELSLFVDNGGDDRHQDHVDWANAQIKCR